MPDSVFILDLVEKEKLDEVLEGFTNITGISSFLVDPSGRPISDQHNWSGLCSDYCRSTEEGKRRCYQSDRYGGEMSAKLKKRFVYPCLNAGLIDCTSPIIVGKYHIATFMCGQVLHKPIDEATAEKHAREIGIEDIPGYIEAIRNIPIISNERLNTIVDFMEIVTNTISDLAWSKYISSKRSRRYLDRLINQVSDGIISIDVHGRISMVNDAFQKIIGLRKNEIIGQYFPKYIMGDNAKDAYKRIIRRVDQEGHGRASVEIVNTSDEKIPVQVAFTRTGDGKTHTSYVAVLRDMSEEVKIAQLKEDLIGMMTHDLGNPIFSIQKAMQLLSSSVLGPLNTGQEELIKLTLNTTRQLSGMVNDYLDIYRYENGKLRLRKEILDMRSIILESIKQVELIAAEKEILILYDSPSEALNFMGDRMRMVRVFLNLLVNAIKCSPDGRKIVIETRYVTNSDGMLCEAYYNSDNALMHRPEPGQQYLLTEITDQGPGIEEGFKSEIFNKFAKLKNADAYSTAGAGLGLAFCKLAVEAHRGFIWVNSPVNREKNAKGSGSRFYFALPAEVKVRFDSLGIEF